MLTSEVFAYLERCSNSGVVFKSTDNFCGGHQLLWLSNSLSNSGYYQFKTITAKGTLEERDSTEFIDGMLRNDMTWTIYGKQISFTNMLKAIVSPDVRKVWVVHRMFTCEPMFFDDLMVRLSGSLGAHNLAKVIKDGDWFIMGKEGELETCKQD